MTRLGWKPAVQIAAVILIAASLKYFYSSATVEDLLWLLWPTAASVELVSGTQFEFEAYAGYLNTEKNFLIAPVCSGMNFLITAFLLLSILSLWHNRSKGARWRFLLTSATAAYITTIAANTVRIASALSSHGKTPVSGWFDRDQVHRIEGIAVYFGFLMVLFFVSEIMNAERRAMWRTGQQALFSFMIPLLIYYAMTIGVPLANGGYLQGGEFWEHSLFVLVTPLLILIPCVMYQYLASHGTETGIR